MSRLRKSLLVLLLLLSMSSTFGMRCHDDSEMIDQHQRKLDEEEE